MAFIPEIDSESINGNASFIPDIEGEYRDYLKKQGIKKGRIDAYIKKHGVIPENDLEWLKTPISDSGNAIGVPSKGEFAKKSKYDSWLDQLAEEHAQYEKKKNEVPLLYTQDYDRWQLGDEHRSAKAIGANYDQGTIDELVNRDEKEAMRNNQTWQTLRTQAENLWNNARQLGSENALFIGQQRGLTKGSSEWNSLQGQIEQNNAMIDEINGIGSTLNMELDKAKAPDRFARLNFNRKQIEASGGNSSINNEETIAYNKVEKDLQKGIGTNSIITNALIDDFIDKAITDPKMNDAIKSKRREDLSKIAQHVKDEKKKNHEWGLTIIPREKEVKGNLQQIQNMFDLFFKYVNGKQTYNDYLLIKESLPSYKPEDIGSVNNDDFMSEIGNIIGVGDLLSSSKDPQKDFDKNHKKNVDILARKRMKELQKRGAAFNKGGK